MASSDDTERDAKRASTRGFGGYLLDRATGRADFKKAASPGSSAAALPITPKTTRRAGVPDDAYAAGGLVRRGFGKARGA